MGICLIVVAKRGGSKSIVPYVSGSTIVRDRCREATAIVTGGIGFRLFYLRWSEKRKEPDMPGGREVTEEIEDAVQANKVIALLIAVLALFLALASAGGKWAQTAAISENVEAADLWTFYQAKAIRASTLLTAAERLESETVAESNPTAKATKEQQSNSWKQTAARYESEPET